MKRFHPYIGFAFLVWALSCTRITDDPTPSQIPFEEQTGPLPELVVAVDSVHLSQTVRFDSIAQGGNFSVQFTPLRFGKIKIVENGKAVQVQMDTGRWEKDSSQYTICKNSVCRAGWMRIKNSGYKPLPVDTTDTLQTGCITLATRTLYMNFSFSLNIRNLFPTGVKGTIDSLSADLYQVSKTNDSTLRYTTNPLSDPDEPNWAFDTIRYKATSLSGQCYKAKIAFILGNTCEPEARDDLFTLPTGNALWAESALTVNDTGCLGQLGNYQTRTPYTPLETWNYGNYKVLNTRFGILTDTLVDNIQHYKYQRTNSSATEDGFTYYFKNLVTGRATKAWVRIKF